MDTLLKRIRTRANFKSTQAFEAFGVHQSQYSRIELGEVSVTSELATKIASYFGVQVATIFNPSRYVAVPLSDEKPASESGAEALRLASANNDQQAA